MRYIKMTTDNLLEAIENGLLDKDFVIEACVKYMGENSVSDMCQQNEIFYHEIFPENEKDDEYDDRFNYSYDDE